MLISEAIAGQGVIMGVVFGWGVAGGCNFGELCSLTRQLTAGVIRDGSEFYREHVHKNVK